MSGISKRTPLERFWSKVLKTDNCWEWTGGKNGEGYGVFFVIVNGVYTYPLAHRFSYTQFVGTIPSKLVIDHICENPSCVRPDHLRAVSNRYNVIRSGKGPIGQNAARTHCIRGHLLGGDNARKNDGRQCRTCRIMRSERLRRKSGVSARTPRKYGNRKEYYLANKTHINALREIRRKIYRKEN